MRIFDQAYIDGAFRPVLGREELTLVDPTSEVETGRLRLADAQDAKLAVDAASRALPCGPPHPKQSGSICSTLWPKPSRPAPMC